MKTMNESRFKFFLLYMIDLHNLHIENRVDLISNPLNEKRDNKIKSLKLRVNDIIDEKKISDCKAADIDDLVNEIGCKLTLEEDVEVDSFELCFTR